MRSFDLTPLYRATVGFDQIADLMDRALATDVGQSSYSIRTCAVSRYVFTDPAAGPSPSTIAMPAGSAG